MTPFEQAQAIIADRGADFAQADLDAVKDLITQIDLDQAGECEGALFEAISLIVNHPTYTGDCAPID